MIPNFLIYLIVGVVTVIIVAALIVFLVDFFRELRYLNKEIQCNHGAARRYWVRQRRRLLLSLLPFVKY